MTDRRSFVELSALGSGATCATGLGEAVIRVCGSHLVVELMRHGHEPGQACKLAIERIITSARASKVCRSAS
jgi:N4-(beta-N-acetylglucosaminyl)-L-asparaginase